MRRFWENWDELEPLLRANGIPLSLGRDVSGLVGAWVRETMEFWEKDYKVRMGVVAKAISLLRRQPASQRLQLQLGVDPVAQARKLANLSPGDWSQTLKLILQNLIPLEVLEALMAIWNGEDYCIYPPPFDHASEILTLAIHGETASLVVIPTSACAPNGEFKYPNPLFCLPFRPEILAQRDPLLDPPLLAPTFRTIRPPKRKPTQDDGLLDCLQVLHWRRVIDQDYGWRMLAWGAIGMGDMYLWTAGPLNEFEETYPEVRGA